MCDTFVALPGATADGSVILAKNSDREPNEAHHLVIEPAAHHHGGETVQATYRRVPQVRHTYAVLLAKPYWIWGAEMGVNEHGVAIGNEAVFTTERHEKQPGLLGMDLLRLGLERGATAQEAANTICQLLAEYGQSGQAGHTNTLEYHNSFLIADPSGALLLETVGRDWVIQRVSGTRSISNALTVHDEWDEASGALAKPGVDIAAEYSDIIYTRFSDARARQCRTSDALQARHGAITVADAMALLRDHGGAGEGFSPADGLLGQTVCAHAGYGPIRVSQSVGSMVARISAERTTVWLTGTSAPCLSVFKPVWLDAGLPDLGPVPDGSYDPRTLWWRHENLHRAVLADYPGRAPLLEPVIAELEREFLAREAVVDQSPAARAELSAACFAESLAGLAPLLPSVAQQPIGKAAPRLYARAWRNWDRKAQR